MSDREKQQTYKAVVLAIKIINDKQEALNRYRDEALSYAATNPGNYSFNFNMDFMNVKHKLLLGYLQSVYSNQRQRETKILNESKKIAEETEASYQEVKESFLVLMNKYVLS
jgi:hypothetical protein